TVHAPLPLPAALPFFGGGDEVAGIRPAAQESDPPVDAALAGLGLETVPVSGDLLPADGHDDHVVVIGEEQLRSRQEGGVSFVGRSEEHTSELQSRENL